MMRKYYNEGINNIINVNAFKTIDNFLNKNILTDNHKICQTVITTPRTNVNTNIINLALDENNNLTDKEINTKYINKYKKHPLNRKLILIKEGYDNYIVNKSFNKKKTKSKEAEKRAIQQEKYTESFIDKNRITKLKLLGDISFLYDDIDKKKFPKIDKIEDNKNGEIIIKTGKYNQINNNKIGNAKFKEYNVLSGFKNPNTIQIKSNKIRQRINSSEIIRHLRQHNNNENDKEKDNSSNNININYENLPEKIKKLFEKSKKKRKSSEFNSKSSLRIKSEKSN